MARELAERLLKHLATCDEVDSLKLVEIFHQDHQKIIGAIKSLQALENNTIEVETLSSKKWEFTEEGQYVMKNGSHEAAVFNAISDNGSDQKEIMNSTPYAKVGFSKALMLGWIELDKSGGKPVVQKKVDSIVDIIQDQLKDVEGISENLRKELKKRKLIQERVVKSFLVRKGSNFSTKIDKLEADLTVDLLMNDGWKEKTFKPYNYDALGQSVNSGHLHPLLKVRSEFRKIFIELGFEEMPTNNFVESSFWNFDALFVPQQHPARDDHDTFFISEPKLTQNLPNDYVERVKKVHSVGGYGSLGYRYDWKLEETQKNVLRTHTTAVSARMLYKLMQKGEFKPVKFFSIDRVFRNETLDATHLAEFHQVEGVVADYNINLGNLIGILYEFFNKLGITQLRFKPAYNPYTEPSMEIFCFHNKLEKWIEIGNSGVFRPELLLPLGLPENVNVLGWGLSLERPTMIKYGLSNIRDLVGPKVDLQMVHNNALCRLEKHSSYKVQQQKQVNDLELRWNKIITETAQLTIDLPKTSSVKNSTNVVIFCDPKKHPVRFFELFFELVKNKFSVGVMVHLHSSIVKPDLKHNNFCSKFRKNIGKADINVTLIWKEGESEPCMRVQGQTKIVGLVNIGRYLNRVVESRTPELMPYESKGPLYANRVDEILEDIHCSLLVDGKFRNGVSKYVMGDSISIADIIYQSML